MFQKTLIIGLGLIGGSFAKAIKKANLSKEIYACDFDQESIDYAKDSSVINDGFSDLSLFGETLSEFDFIIVATPLSEYEEIFFKLKKLNALVIDLGSIKDLEIKNLPKNFIACHPIAGSENTGFENSDSELFSGKKFILSKENAELSEAIKKIGAIPEILEARKHDKIYALVSHLPQFLSFLTAEFSPKKITDDFFAKAFRLHDSDPEIWSDIFEMNEENLERYYEEFFENLDIIIGKLCDEDYSLFNDSENKEKFDPIFLEKNFPHILFRALTAKALLEIKDIKKFKDYSGTGFRDFTSITSILSYDRKKLENLFAENRSKILKFFYSLQ